MTESLPIDGNSLNLEQFLSVVRGRSTVSLSPDARAAVLASRAVVEAAVRRGRPVYGVTTGFGQLSDKIVPSAQAKELQIGLVRSHASGAGEPLSEEVVRGVVLVRANSLARGHSGVRPVVIETLLAILNRGLTPYVPSQGSVGASGDLAPLAHVALALTGEGEFVGPHGTRVPAAAVLVDHGIPPLELAEKEGVALVNGTSLMTSYLTLALADATSLFDAALIAAALSFDALEGDPEALDDRLGELRNFPEQRQVAKSLRALLAGSSLSAPR
ncbi:MAG: aromatic amino acid lyase, partial [Thermoplasmata archaeon]|nr:aromatic amino acid lyase [Thermoplasmata archaeon]